MQFDQYPTHTLMAITDRPPLVFVHGEGAWLWDNVSRRYRR